MVSINVLEESLDEILITDNFAVIFKISKDNEEYDRLIDEIFNLATPFLNEDIFFYQVETNEENALEIYLHGEKREYHGSWDFKQIKNFLMGVKEAKVGYIAKLDQIPVMNHHFFVHIDQINYERN